jgi:hypothetical protein
MRRTVQMGWIVGISLCLGCALTAAAVQEIEPNDATPQAVGALSKPSTTILVDGTSGYAGDLDWFSFEVGGSGSQTVRLATESDVSWQIVLYADDLTHIDSGTGSLTRDLAPGRYRVRIQPSDLGTGSYVFLISNALEHESNDGLMEANALGTLGDEPLGAFASIAPAGDVDFFSFDVPEDFAAGLAPGMSRIVRIETPCPSGDTLLLLYTEDKTLERAVPVARNDDSGAGSWSRLYVVQPKPGRYTLRVHEYADNETIATYRVVVTAMTISNTEPNDTPGEATPLGALAPGGRLETTQFVDEGDVDAFSFTVSAATCVLFETSGASGGDSLVCLYDQEGNEIACDDDGGNGVWSRLFRKVDAGRYVVTVRAVDGESLFDYTLTLTTAACPAEGPESEPNDSVGTADPIALPYDIAAEIAPGNADVYRFALTTPATVIAETYGAAAGDTTVCLLDAEGNTIVCDDDGGAGLWSLVQYELDPGTYYLRVELFAGTGPVAYHLLVRAEP